MACKLSVAIHPLQPSHIAGFFFFFAIVKGFAWGGGRYLQSQLSE